MINRITEIAITTFEQKLFIKLHFSENSEHTLSTIKKCM